MSQPFGEELLGNLSYERSKTWSNFFKNCLNKDDGKEFEFEELGELFQSEDEADNDDAIEEAKECEVKHDLNKSTQSLTNTELTLLLCHGDQSKILSQTLPIMEEHERKWKQAGLDRILNTFDADKIEQHVGGWLRRHKSSFANCSTSATAATTVKHVGEVYTSSRSNDSDGESMHSMDTARYIRASRKRNISTKSSTSLTTIKMYRTLPRKRAELRAKYACQADELLEEQQHRRHMQAMSQRRIHYSRHHGHCHSVTSVTVSAQQRRKMFRKRRYTSLVAAASSSSSSDECECRKRCCSYRIYRYHSECHCRGQDCLPAPWMRGSGTMWAKRKTSSPATELAQVPNKMCRLESEVLEDDFLSSSTELSPRSPASISTSENPINIRKRMEKSEQSQIDSLHTASSLNINQSTKATVFSTGSQTDNEEIDSSKSLLNMNQRLEKRKHSTPKETNSNSPNVPMTTRSRASTSQNVMMDLQSASSRSSIDIRRRTKVKRKQLQRSLQDIDSDATNSSLQIQAISSTRSSAAKQENGSCEKKCQQFSTREKINSNSLKSSFYANADLQNDSSEDSIYMRRRTKKKQNQSQRDSDIKDSNEAMSTKGSSSTTEQSEISDNILNGSQRREEKRMDELTNSNSPIHANTDLLTRHRTPEIIELLSDSSEESTNVIMKHSKSQQQVLDFDPEPQAAFVVTEKGILLHKPSSVETETDMNSSENGYDKFVLTANILSPIIGRRKASRFMKYHIGTCIYDRRLHIYYRPSAKILANLKVSSVPGDSDSSSCSESDDVFEMVGRYGSIVESNT